MRRIIVIALGVAVVAAIAALATGRLNSGGGYRIRAVFDNAGFTAAGEDVKVDGVVVGKIDSLDLAHDRKAVLNLQITDRRFTPFHTNAHCTIRSEGLLAVKFVDCSQGTTARPALAAVTSGSDAGSYLLPVQDTSSPVDLDLVNNVFRQPRGEELALLLSEFGTGLAARGSDLNSVIHRANPGLDSTDRVLRILAGENQRLVKLAEDSDQVLAPLAAEQRSLAGFVTSASVTNQATALQSHALGQSFARLPAFLQQLRASMADLGQLSDQALPVLSELHGAAPSLGRATAELKQFAGPGRSAFQSLGALADRAGPDLLRSRPLINELQDLGSHLRPAAANLDQLTASLDRKNAIDRFMRLIFNLANSATGFDSVGHYMRAELLSGACSRYDTSALFGCHAKWGSLSASATPSSSTATATAAQSKSMALVNYLLGP